MNEKPRARTDWGVSILALELGFVIGVGAFLALNAHQAVRRAEAVIGPHRPGYQACLSDPACRKKMRLPPLKSRATPAPRRQLADPFWDRA